MINPFSDVDYGWQELLQDVKDQHRHGLTGWMLNSSWTVPRLRRIQWIFP